MRKHPKACFLQEFSDDVKTFRRFSVRPASSSAILPVESQPKEKSLNNQVQNQNRILNSIKLLFNYLTNRYVCFQFLFFFFRGRQVFPQLNKKNYEAKQKLKPFPPQRKVLAVLHCITFMHHLNINYCLLLVLTCLKARASGGLQRNRRSGRKCRDVVRELKERSYLCGKT